MKQTIKTGLAALVLLLAISCKKENSSIQTSSIDGNNLAQNVLTDDKVLAGNTVKIGSQVWMTKNLDESRYRNGDKILQVKNPNAWSGLIEGAWCWYNNDSATGAIYGKLYNWYAVNDPRGLAPTGYHVPSNMEWKKLINYLGSVVAGGKMKSTGTIEAGNGLWLAPNTDATNSSGFTGLPGGYRTISGAFDYVGRFGYWWSSTEANATLVWYRYLFFYDGICGGEFSNKQNGFSVRCVKD